MFAIVGDGALSGTAFLYQGHIITAGHVCDAWFDLFINDLTEPMKLRFVRGDGFGVGGEYIPKKWAYDDKHDVCELRAIDDTKHNLDDLEPADDISIGDPVSIIGAPLGLALYRTDGYVASVMDPAVGGLITVSAPAYGGNSGSPVLNAEGKLVGILVAGIRAYPFISVVVPTQQIDDLIAN